MPAEKSAERPQVVCDTNIIVSALVFPGGAPDQIINLARLGEFTLCISPDILTELRRVLSLKFKYPDDEIVEIVDRILAISRLVYPHERIDLIAGDKSDNRILECAMATQAGYLVTGDKKDILPLKTIGKTRILTASQFLEVMKKL